jgi:RsiW-degrading membrane proteinase PrsW (M82 family)
MRGGPPARNPGLASPRPHRGVYSGRRVDGASHLYLAASGIVPALIAMWYVDRLDRQRPEPPRLRRKVAFYGALSVIPVVALAYALTRALGAAVPPEHTYVGALYHAFVQAAALEELCKIAVVYWVFARPEFDERLDGIVYACRAGLGFALVENVLYLLGQQELGGLLVTWVLRALLAIPGHAMWTGMMGYFLARRRFDRTGPGIVGGYLIAVLLHGTYDVAIFVGVPLTADGRGELALALLVVPAAVVALSVLWMRRMARTALQLDDADAARRARGQGGGPGQAWANVF